MRIKRKVQILEGQCEADGCPSTLVIVCPSWATFEKLKAEGWNPSYYCFGHAIERGFCWCCGGFFGESDHPQKSYKRRFLMEKRICPGCCVPEAVCQEEGCSSLDVKRFKIHRGRGRKILTFDICFSHAAENGFCWDCGGFFAGSRDEAFLEWHGLCPNCHEPEPEDLPDEWGAVQEEYPGDLLATDIDFDL